MTRMFRTIGWHLKPGGTFVGLNIPPLLSTSPAEREILDSLCSKTDAWGKYGNGGKVLAPMPNGDGYKVRIEFGLPEVGHEIAAFDCYYLRNGIFEEACQKSGMFEGLEWKEFDVPEEVKQGRWVGFWNEMVLAPSCRICVARRLQG